MEGIDPSRRLAPGDSIDVTVTVEATQWESWRQQFEVKHKGIDTPVRLPLFLETKLPSPPVYPPATSERLEVSFSPLAADRRWLGWLGAAVVGLALGTVYLAWLARWRKLDLEEFPAPAVDAAGEGFSIAAIGGPRRTVIQQKKAQRLADTLGQVSTDELSPRLDLPRTIDSTIQSGGFPEFVWQAEQVTRRVLILEDKSLDPVHHNRVIDDLKRGLERTGVEVQHAWFRNGVGQFADTRGVNRELRELHAWQHQYVVLVYTDGSGLARQSARKSLLPLSKLPAAAILDPRQGSRRKNSTDVLAGLPLPRFSANESGVAAAFRSFIRGTNGVASEVEQRREKRSLVRRASLSGVEVALGDSLLWAADCVWLQPCSLALAESLRSEFHPHLSADRIQRILELPDVSSNTEGFRFGRDSRNELRTAWKQRRSDDEKQAVLECIDQHVANTEPKDADSTAHQVW